ncbi:hypothetical protein U9Z33_21600 [Escherichia coli]
MNNIEIVEAVKDGMRNAARETRFMNFSSRGKINAEYFATVSIGLALRNSPSFQFDDEKIMFEYNTGDFITSTIPLSKKLSLGYIFPKILRRIRANTTRKGRIDIALLGNNNGIDYPKCAIEVKGDNPSKALLHADLRRNIEYFKHSGATGKSDLALTLNCVFEAFNNNSNSKKSCSTEIERNEKIIEIEKKYTSYINEIKHEIPQGISDSIEVFSASEHLAGPNCSQEEYYHIEDHIHLILGVLIKLER